MTGVVATFDEGRGIGEIENGEGSRYFFHCTRIADGSRTIAPRTAVEFEIVAGHLGRWEAVAIKPATD